MVFETEGGHTVFVPDSWAEGVWRVMGRASVNAEELGSAWGRWLALILNTGDSWELWRSLRSVNADRAERYCTASGRGMVGLGRSGNPSFCRAG